VHAPITAFGEQMPGKSFLSTFRFRLYSWQTLALTLLSVQALSLIFKHRASVAYALTIYFLLLLVATGVAIQNAVRNTHAVRLFWTLLAGGCGLWALSAWSWIYYVMILGKNLPDFFPATSGLFLHTVLMIAAVASRPHLKLSRLRPYRTTLNFLLLLSFVVFLYAYLMFPYEYSYTSPHPAFILLRFQVFYSAENLCLLLVLAMAIRRAEPPWRSIYWHLLGASALYALGTLAPNIVVALRGYSPSLLDVPYTASAFWLAWITLWGRERARQLAQPAQIDAGDTKYLPILSMLAVVTIPVLGVWELFRADEQPDARMIRLLVVLVSGLLVAQLVFVRDYLANRELASDVGLAKEQYRRIVETTNEGVWLLDVEFHTSYANQQMAVMLGYEPGEMIGRSVFDFYFPEDIDRKRQALQSRREGLREHFDDRLRRKDGTELWVRTAAIPLYNDNGEFEGAMAMMSDVTEQKRAERALRDSEQRFRLVANTAPVLIWMSGPDKMCTYFNQPWLEFTGRSLAAELGKGWAEGVHPEDLGTCWDTYTQAFDRREMFKMEYRLRRQDGEYRWMLDIGVPRSGADGSFDGYIGSCIDVTSRKIAEEALSTVSRRLIEAQEQERSWIARELHDDINQGIALLAVRLGQIEQDCPPSNGELRRRIHDVGQQISQTGQNVQALSHRLHSSKLQYLGLAAAARGFCKEWSEQQKVKIDCNIDSIPTNLPPEISLCLFRVLQEGLQNATKHSGVRSFKVELRGDLDDIKLTVSDLGVGFDVEVAIRSHGLGLISMQERLQLVKGHIAIESQPNRGATIRARVPLGSGSDSVRAAE